MLLQRIEQAKIYEESIDHVTFKNEELEGVDLEKVEFDQVVFQNCRFVNCNFTKGAFYNVAFENCDLSNSKFNSSYWKDSRLANSKGFGCDFNQSTFKSFILDGGGYRYSNFVQTSWENSLLKDCDLTETFLSEIKWKKLTFQQVILRKAECFRTYLRGIDLSDCVIEEIVVSDTFAELKGAKISTAQSLDIALLVGMKFV